MGDSLTLADLQKMIDACPSMEPKEFRGASGTIRDLARIVVASRIGPMEPVAIAEVYGFPVVVDERCAPGTLYFGRSEDFKRADERFAELFIPRPPAGERRE